MNVVCLYVECVCTVICAREFSLRTLKFNKSQPFTMHDGDEGYKIINLGNNMTPLYGDLFIETEKSFFKCSHSLVYDTMQG